MDYFDILLAKKLNGGGGDVTVVPLSVTDNGIYSEEGKAYSPVTVSVQPPEDSYQLKSITTPTPLATFNASAMPMPSLKVSVEAKQDLHGYDKPWVGGAGKNKLANVLSELKSNNTSGTWSGNVYTTNGGTIEILTDTADNILGYKVNGTFTGISSFILAGTAYKLLSDFANNSNFVISQEVEGTGTNGLCLQRQETGSNIYIPNNQNYTTVNPSGDTTNHYRPILRFNNGDSIANKTYVLMIRNSADSTTFAPYSNICPISGWDNAIVADTDDVDNPTVTQTTTISLGQTVYGGEVDVVNGTSGNKVTHQLETISGGISRTDSSGYLFVVKDLDVPDITDYETVTPYIISNYLTPYSVNDLRANAVFGFTQYNKRLYIRLGADITTVADANAFLASNPLQVCYELATPTTLTTQPTPIKSLEGINNLSVDCGEIIEGEYFKAL